MNVNWKALQLIAATQVAALALAGCAQLAPAWSGVAVPAAPKNVVVAHAAGVPHTAQPKRLEAVVEIDMHEFSFSVPGAPGTAAVKVPAGKTVGLHLHNEGAVMHELVIGRKPVEFVEREVDGKKVSVPDGYAKALFEDLEADVFFYYGEGKAEIGGATFEEIEVEPGLRDIWLRFKVPPELAGEWELGCFVPGHYEAGMYATLIIE
ncbi:MAG: hypothetical protein HYY04_09570 [Chloroflexi bacterium]|nr:hypothetical protein [Chloroflexota bacterium]